MHLPSTLALAALVAALATPCARADEPGPDVIVKRSHARRHVLVKAVSVHRAERDGAVLFSGKVMSRDYAYPRYSPGLLPTSAAVAYGYAYAPDYGFAYRLVPPVPAGATCVEQPNLVYNTQGVFVGYGSGYSCY
ncbi:MAG: hypothetical protein JOZ84_13870 [Methylobacteriaceae bacterium]|nr:hypothetical protein [Methylobacteriaceae bacterium]